MLQQVDRIKLLPKFVIVQAYTGMQKLPQTSIQHTVLEPSYQGIHLVFFFPSTLLIKQETEDKSCWLSKVLFIESQLWLKLVDSTELVHFDLNYVKFFSSFAQVVTIKTWAGVQICTLPNVISYAWQSKWYWQKYSRLRQRLQKFSSLFKAKPVYEGRLKVILLLQVSSYEFEPTFIIFCLN